IEAIGALAQPNQDFVLAVLPILVRGATADLVGDPSTLAEMVDQLRAAAARLESRAALRVGAALFCREVWACGRYDPWPPNQTYRPNQQAHLYVEVRHLVSEPTIGPRGEPYLTVGRATVEVRDATDKVVPQPDPADYRRRVELVRFETKKFTR